MIRLIWLLLAAAALSMAAWHGATATMADIDGACSKIGEPSGDYACADKQLAVLGPWATLGPALLVVLPPLLAAWARRVWASWLATAVLAAFAATGFLLLMADTPWSTLIGALPLAAAAALLSLRHTFGPESASGP